jgi:hypothetical protein
MSEKTRGKPQRKLKPRPPAKPPALDKDRGQSRSAQYRLQFAWAEEAVSASSTIAATWLQKPAPDGSAILLGLFYFRRPDRHRHKAQVWQITRKGGAITTQFIGSAPGHTEAYREFYQPIRLRVRTAQKEAKTAAMAAAGQRAARAADMAARIVIGKPAKNDKRDLAVALRG